VTLTSTDPDDPAVCAATVIAGSGPRVMFADEETVDCALAGFTVSGGSYGILCSGATPTIENCTVADNSCAGVKVWNKGRPTVSRCEIVGNGFGVDLWTPRDKRVLFNNFGTFRNCLIAGNLKAGVNAGYPTLENCTVADNRGAGVDAVLANITNSIIYFNNETEETGAVNLAVERPQSVVTYSDVQGSWQGDGNIDADPLFVARGQWVATEDVVIPLGTGNRVAIVPGTPVWTAGDYHLKSQGWSWSVLQGIWASDDATSPCIDAGDPAAPLGDEQPCATGDPLSDRAGANSRINMGAHGGTAEASLAPHVQTPQP
jgi:parallel beta-helix repeat protein